MYSKPKIPATDAKRLILDEIKTKLEQNPLFQNNSLAFYSFNCEASLTIKVVARGTETVKVNATISQGSTPVAEKRGEVKEEPKALTATLTTTIEKP